MGFGGAAVLQQGDNCLLDVTTAALQGPGGLGTAAVGHFHQDVLCPHFQLFVGELYVHHQILICLADVHHAACGDHVQNQLLGSAGFQASGAGEHFRACYRFNGQVGFLPNQGACVASNGDGLAADAPGVAQAVDDIGCPAAGGQSDDQIRRL